MSEAAISTDTAVSFYKNARNKTGVTSNLHVIMDGIRNGNWEKEVEAVRNEKDKTRRSRLKQGVPAFTPSGVFAERKVSGLQCHSGVLAIDFDLEDNPQLGVELASVRATLEKDKFSEYVSLSVSGQGLFVIIKIDEAKHTENFLYLEQYYKETYGLVIDKSCKDVSRLRFVSYDPNLYHNKDAEKYCESAQEYTKMCQPAQKDAKAYPSSQDDNARIMADIVKSGKMIGDDSYGDWVTIGFALAATFGEAGRGYFHALSQRGVKYDAGECDKKYSNCIETNQGKVKFGTIVHMAKHAGVVLSQPKQGDWPEGLGKTRKRSKEIVGLGSFWVVLEEGDIDLCTVTLFQEFLPANGFRRYKVNPNDSAYVYVRISGSLVEPVLPVQIKDFVLDYLKKEKQNAVKEEKKTLKKVFRKVQASSGFLFSEWQINSLPYVTIDFLRDTFDTCYLFFSNGVVEIKKDSTCLHPYTKLQELEKFVWKKSVNPHVFCEADTPSMFAEFVANTSSYVLTEDERAAESALGEEHLPVGERWMRMSDLESKITAFGYLMHGYKDVASCPVVIGCDAQISEKGVAEGGTGKSLFLVQALSQAKNLLQIDGQTTDLSDRFCFQQVTPDTHIIAFDDANWKFDFRTLFQRVTGNFSVERKNAMKLDIPFEVSPKMCITSNHTFKGEGHSFTRRQHIIEFSDYYKLRTPKEVHNKALFTAWNYEERNAFFSFAIHCIQEYFEKGLVAPKIRNYETRKLLDSTPDGFSEWADSSITLNKEFLRNDLIEDYKSVTGDIEIKPKVFTESLLRWVRHRGFTYNPSTNGKRDIRNGKTHVFIAKIAKNN
ncbi:MAG: putative helicase [Candidatus Jettenia ecosi]|uniref:Putative helicase n=1 Tax=Candidatus Jettenia ecosi TaxID=2494326 RepID=A0A533QAU7_9BACT|nr:MAG: putative helicase [Candidatus Jettenia ecosi]